MKVRQSLMMFTPSGRSFLAVADWRSRARCRSESADAFYPPENEKGNARRLRVLRAKQICQSCPVLEPCRRYAIDTEEPHGIWGATTPEDREQLMPARNARYYSAAEACGGNTNMNINTTAIKGLS